MFLDFNKKPSFNRVACYIRRSRADEERERRTGEDTLTGQRLYMEDLLKRLGVEYDLFQEVASGSTIEGRQIFQNLLEGIQKGKYDAIAVKEISRITRGNYSDLALIEKSFKRNRIKIITDYSILDLKNPDDESTFDTQLYFSRSEYKRTTHRMISARIAFAMVGKWQTGSVPFGYRIHKTTGKLDPVEEEAELVRYIFNLYVYGIDGKDIGFKAISNHLKKQGILSPRGSDKWDPSVLKNMILNPAYKGDVRFYTTEVQDGRKVKRPKEEHVYVEQAHDAIVDSEIWEKANSKLESPSVIVPKRRSIETSALSGLVLCKKCGKHMYKSQQPRRYKRMDGSIRESVSVTLRCRTMGCTTIKYELVEQQVLVMLEQLKSLENEALKTYLTQALKFEKKSDKLFQEQKGFELEKIQESLEKLKKRKNRIQELYEDGDYTRDEYMERKKAIHQEIEKLNVLENELTLTDDEIAAAQEQRIDVQKTKVNIRRIVDLYSVLETNEEKNNLLRKVLYHIKLNRIKKGVSKKHPQFELEVTLKEAIMGEGLL